MKLSINWLKDYIDPQMSTDALVDRLTMAGLEVGPIEAIAADTILEIEITPNRSDCLSILGLAREVSGIIGKAVKGPKIKNHKTKALKNAIRIENKKDCSRYIATLIRDVLIMEAPPGMKKRLASLGLHSINNAVDVTNFVLMETGQPLHAFDYDKLAGGIINVRRAKPGERIVTIDGIERKLDTSILVIADAEKPVAIAGIMGGRDTQITADTKNILLESAHFDMGIIRRASRTLGLRSDSSYRFERNVNFEGVLTGANRATDLLLELTAGQLAGRAQVAGKSNTLIRKIKIKFSDIESMLGMELRPSAARDCLSRLGFKVTAQGGSLSVVPPSNRPDIGQEADVIEEIARMTGFDHLPSQLPVIKSANITIDKKPREVKDQIRKALTAAGVDEIITLSMISAKALVKSNLAQMPGVSILNPLSQDQELMRPVLLPSFLQAAVTNINRGQKDLRFFEIAKTYSKPKERESLGILMTGRRSHDWRTAKKEGVDIFDLKGALERIFQKLEVSASYEDTTMPAFDPACTAYILVDGQQIGILGKVAHDVLNNWDIKHQDIYFAALYLDALFLKGGQSIEYQPISEYPAVVRDVSLAVKKEIPYKRIEAICTQQGGNILRSVHFIEQYLGDKIPHGYKGLVFSCHYQSDTRTLREDEVASVHEGILQALVRDLSAIRR